MTGLAEKHKNKNISVEKFNTKAINNCTEWDRGNRKREQQRESLEETLAGWVRVER